MVSYKFDTSEPCRKVSSVINTWGNRVKRQSNKFPSWTIPAPLSPARTVPHSPLGRRHWRSNTQWSRKFRLSGKSTILRPRSALVTPSGRAKVGIEPGVPQSNWIEIKYKISCPLLVPIQCFLNSKQLYLKCQAHFNDNLEFRRIECWKLVVRNQQRIMESSSSSEESWKICLRFIVIHTTAAQIVTSISRHEQIHPRRSS